MLQVFLEQKMALNYKIQIQNLQELENQLLISEHSIKSKVMEQENIDKDIKKSGINKIAFVPNHLGFGCREGVQIYEITVKDLQTTYVAIKP